MFWCFFVCVLVHINIARIGLSTHEYGKNRFSLYASCGIRTNFGGEGGGGESSGCFRSSGCFQSRVSFVSVWLRFLKCVSASEEYLFGGWVSPVCDMCCT